jgi:hypothetical protein
MWSRIFRSCVASLAIVVCLTGCNKQSGAGGSTYPSTALFTVPAGGRLAGYVDMEKIVTAHPLHGEMDSLQAQITALTAKQQQVPQAQTPAQKTAEAEMQRELAAAQTQFQDEINRRRAFYQQEEANAIAAVQNKALAGTGASQITGNVQQQFGEQVKQIQTDAGKAYIAYQQSLYKQDNAHLAEVSQRLHADVSAKVQDRRNKLEAAETAYQLKLSHDDQDQKLNLKIKLESSALTPDERAQYAGQLQNIQTREDARINQMKSVDNDALTQYQTQLQRAAAASFEAERTKTASETNAKLQERQKQMSDQLKTQVTGIGSKFQEQLNSANQTLAKNPQVKADIDRIHAAEEAKYSDELNKTMASYEDTRKALVTKYSAIAHMQFQDNVALADQADRLAQARRDLLAKIVEQVRQQVADIASKQGVAVVLTSVRGAGSAIDLTDQVQKAVQALASPAAAPTISPTAQPGG